MNLKMLFYKIRRLVVAQTTNKLNKHMNANINNDKNQIAQTDVQLTNAHCAAASKPPRKLVWKSDSTITDSRQPSRNELASSQLDFDEMSCFMPIKTDADWDHDSDVSCYTDFLLSGDVLGPRSLDHL